MIATDCHAHLFIDLLINKIAGLRKKIERERSGAQVIANFVAFVLMSATLTLFSQFTIISIDKVSLFWMI